MASPLLYVALSFSAGILIASLLPLGPVLPSVLICLSLATAWIFWKTTVRLSLAFTGIMCVCFLSGAGFFWHKDNLYQTSLLTNLKTRDLKFCLMIAKNQRA